MINLDYSQWKKGCECIHKIKNSVLRNTLQWYPVSKLKTKQRIKISSEDFFNTYIKSGTYILSNNFQGRYQYFLPKGDSNLRNVSLINPIDLYFITSFGFYLNSKFIDKRDPRYFSVFYAGDLSNSSITYNKPYDDFYKKINYFKDKYENFIKIDIQNFYPSINMNILIQLLLEKCELSASEGEFLKDYLLYLGNGDFPLIENSTTLSFLATKVYLENIDISLTKFLKNFTLINDFYCVRYVDDLYIFFNPTSGNDLAHIKNSLIFELTSILQDYNLMYNSSKLACSDCGDIDEYLKRSFYWEDSDKIGFNILDMFDKSLIKNFLLELIESQKNQTLNVEKYNNIIDKVFVLEGVEYSSQEIFRNFCYNLNRYLNDCNEEINSILSDNFDILKLDVNNLIFLILETKDEDSIKKLLNKIYVNIREAKYDKFNTKIIIQYLLKRNFANKEFIEILKKQEPALYNYIRLFCLNNFYDKIKNDKFVKNFNSKYFYSKDNLLLCLHNEFIFNYKRNNYLLAFGYFCSYFERLTAHIAFATNPEAQEKEPNYNKYFKESHQKKIWDNDELIKKFRDYRNGVPFIHNNMKKDILDNSCQEINKLTSDLLILIRKKIK